MVRKVSMTYYGMKYIPVFFMNQVMILALTREAMEGRATSSLATSSTIVVWLQNLQG
jgi:hypothetical protein